MFPYDAELAKATSSAAASIPDVLATMQAIDNICVDGDGLKWFNWIYTQVTEAVENRVTVGGFEDSAWLSELDVQFANLFFSALNANLTGNPCPGCWAAMFAVRNQIDIARIQFALAGMNAHINHDLPLAIIATCNATGTVPQHASPQYQDYTGLNDPMDALIDVAKKTLNVRLLGDAMPAESHLEDTIAAWNLATAREKAWDTAESLWQEVPALRAAHMDIIDGLTSVISKVLLVPVP
jgi:Family of unknown function (DUF5995)